MLRVNDSGDGMFVSVASQGKYNVSDTENNSSFTITLITITTHKGIDKNNAIDISNVIFNNCW